MHAHTHTHTHTCVRECDTAQSKAEMISVRCFTEVNDCFLTAGEPRSLIKEKYSLRTSNITQTHTQKIFKTNKTLTVNKSAVS